MALKDGKAHLDPATAVSTMLDLDDYLNVAWLTRVATTRDTELRCHRVALTYSKYAAWLDTWLHGKDSYWYGQYVGKPAKKTDANWFHFSTWAALTVSRNIGSIAAPQRFDGWPNVVRQALAPYVVRARGTDHQRVSQELASAQLQIFINTCVAFLDFKDTTRPQVPRDGLIVDVPKVKLATKGFEYYEAARHTRGPLRERYILLANVMSTLVEQHLINLHLAGVIDAFPNRLSEIAEGRIGQLVERLLGVTRQVTELTVSSRLDTIREGVSSIWGRMLTDQVFVMSLPGEMLRVGRDIPPLKRNGPYYPASLRHPERFPDEVNDDLAAEKSMLLLRNLLARFDHTIGDGRGSAARDWRRYDERMNWAVTLLRSRQQDSSIFWPPYSEEDEERIRDGRMPRRSGEASQIIAPLNNDVCQLEKGSQYGPSALAASRIQAAIDDNNASKGSPT